MSALPRILHVGDEPDIQAVARMALEMVGGFEVKVCSSGEEALRRNPSLADTPVAFMTAKVQPAEVAHYKSLGARGVIAKPFDPVTLAGQVRELWQS